MKRKLQLFVLCILITLHVNSFAQISNYRLQAHYSLDGNANDVSGNAHHGTMTNLTPTTDRFGYSNGAMLFNGTTSKITTTYNGILAKGKRSVSVWAKTSETSYLFLLSWGGPNATAGARFELVLNYGGNSVCPGSSYSYVGYTPFDSTSNDIWHHYVLVSDDSISPNCSKVKVYQDGVLISNQTTVASYNPTTTLNTLSSLTLGIGYDPYTTGFNFKGALDDIRIYDRPLNPSEVREIYRESVCTVTVADTLSINANLTGLSAPNNTAKIKIYPNPTNDKLTVDYGNSALINNYSLKIINSVSQVVYQSTITTSSVEIDLNNWTGKGIYFIQLIDQQGTTLETRKIVLK